MTREWNDEALNIFLTRTIGGRLNSKLDLLAARTIPEALRAEIKTTFVRAALAERLTSASLPRNHHVVKMVFKKVSNLLNLPSSHIENLQVVHYEKGRQYFHHLDAFPRTLRYKDIRMGQRWITLLVYLNDLAPDQGGETDFPKLDLMITPQKGMGVLWWDCFNDGRIDGRTLHAGLPPKYGEKWAFNIWVHFFPLS